LVATADGVSIDIWDENGRLPVPTDTSCVLIEVS